MQFSFSRIVPAVLLLLAAACHYDSADLATSTGPVRCAGRAGDSRWATAAGHYVSTAEYGRRGGDEWLEDVGGVAVSGPQVFVYDAGRARVAVLDTLLHPLRSFGRAGKGPGELTPFRGLRIRGEEWRWLDTSGDTVMVYDGDRIQLFSRDGHLLAQRWNDAVRRGTINPSTPRLRYAAGDLVSPSGGYADAWARTGRDRYVWTLGARSGNHVRPLLSLNLAPLPERNGVPFTGPAQARPLWDLGSGCLVATDGTGRSLLRATLDGTARDSITLDLSGIPQPTVNKEEVERLLGAASRGQNTRYAEPTAPRRFAGLVVDPDGYAWLLPAQDSSHVGPAVEVMRVSLASGDARRDTVPAFPVAFGSPGVFYARQWNRQTGEIVIVRYQLAETPQSQVVR